MKSLLTAFFTLAIAVCTCASVMAADTPVVSDVDETSQQGKAIIKMYNKGYLAGYNDGTFRPDGEVTRAELVRIINQVFGYEENEKLNTTDFYDNSNTNAWYYTDVRIAQQMGYISGFGDNTFRPQDNFTRQQACVVLSIITNATAPETDVVITDEVSPWALSYVNAAVGSGLFDLEEGNTFRAMQNITRGELCVALADFVKEDEPVTESASETTTNDLTTETTTRRHSSSGGGSSSSGSDNSDTTQTTTEVVTEVTTSAPTVTTETTTEVTTSEVVVSDELLTSVRRTARNLTRYVAQNCSTDAQKAVVNDIADAMNSFAADQSYDVEAAANAAMEDYRALGSTEKEELKNLIIRYCAMSDLVLLRDTFFPGLTY